MNYICEGCGKEVNLEEPIAIVGTVTKKSDGRFDELEAHYYCVECNGKRRAGL